jgi:hypothetical protein
MDDDYGWNQPHHLPHSTGPRKRRVWLIKPSWPHRTHLHIQVQHIGQGLASSNSAR